MAGQQPSFPSGFPAAQQQAMINQFGGGQMVPELMGPQQGGLPSGLGMEYTHIESLIPLKEEWDMKSDEKKTSEPYRLACEERKELIDQVTAKNRHLKEIIDHLRRIISEINTMLHMRRS
ncbi:hypothetical protein G9C98_005790 [Cotesia typhae]|uniref:Mediator of RNA polymerase II transcription subunit 30 n=1 Tax=Cotesia typhae TaxID=2053667 RepID=A0A8J5QNV0_9HYME|nr:hypothetical protein G9C98_005790 [Cotesia typhae]